MPFVLYTVTGQRELHYAAVDHETGRVWTAPNKEGAIRQAQDAGLEGFTEKTTSHERLMREMGLGGNLRLGNASPQVGRPEKPPTRRPARPAPMPWFVPGAGDDLASTTPSPIPRPPGRGKKPVHNKGGRSRKGASPFAGSAPIDQPTDDVLIVPSEHEENGKAPFADGEENAEE